MAYGIYDSMADGGMVSCVMAMAYAYNVHNTPQSLLACVARVDIVLLVQ